MDDDGNNDERENRKEDNPRSHRRRPGFILVELSEFGRLSHKCFLTDLLPELVAVQESDIWRDEDKSKEEGKKEIDEKETQISHSWWVVIG